MSFLCQGIAFLRMLEAGWGHLLCWVLRSALSWESHTCCTQGMGKKKFLYLVVKEISWNICCGKGKHTWTHEGVRSPIQIGRQPVLILPAPAASKRGFSDEAADMLAFSPTMCTTIVVFPDAGPCLALFSQLFECFNAICVLEPVHIAAVAFRSFFGS